VLLLVIFLIKLAKTSELIILKRVTFFSAALLLKVELFTKCYIAFAQKKAAQ